MMALALLCFSATKAVARAPVAHPPDHRADLAALVIAAAALYVWRQEMTGPLLGLGF